jgi:hypothetical protein
MRHKSGKHDLQRELHNLVDVVAPRVESAVHTVTEKTPPLVDKGRTVAGTVADRGRTVAIEKGTLLAERLPDNVVDRLPDTVVDRLPVRRRRRGRKLLLLGLLGGLIAGGVVAARRSGKLGGKSTVGAHESYTPPRTSTTGTTGTTTGPMSASDEPPSEEDPSDPLTEPRMNGRFN